MMPIKVVKKVNKAQSQGELTFLLRASLYTHKVNTNKIINIIHKRLQQIIEIRSSLMYIKRKLINNCDLVNYNLFLWKRKFEYQVLFYVGKRFSVENLQRMRLFYKMYSIYSTVSTKLGKRNLL